MRGNLQKIMIGIVVVIVLAFILFSGDSLVKLVDTIKQGTPAFIVAAVAAQVGKYLAQGRGFQACFNTVNGHVSYGTGLSLVFGTFFMNTVAPSFNLAGVTLVVDDSKKRGVSTGQATSAALLMQVTIDSGFVMIMLLGFGILSFTVGLQPGWFALGMVAVLLVGGLVTFMVIGGVRPQWLVKVLTPIERLVDKVARRFKKGPIDPWVDKLVTSFSSSSSMIVKNPKITAKAFGFSFLASTCELACFVFTGMAFGVDVAEPLICGYVVATLFAMISFVPQGVGVVEAAVVVAFTLFKLSQATAMATVLVYRSIVFWLPFLVGAILIQRTSAFKDSGKKGKQSQVADAKAEEVLPENDSGNSGDSAAQPLPDGMAGDSASCKSAE